MVALCCPGGEAILMLSKLAYLTLWRSIQLLSLLARGDAAKDMEILVLRHQLVVLRRQTPPPKLEPADRALLAALSRVLPRSRWSCFLVRPQTLLRWHRRLVAGAWTYPHRPTGRPALNPGVQQLIVPPGQGELHLRLPAHQGRAAAPGELGLGNRSPNHAAPPRAGPSTAADGHHLAGVPPPAGRRDRGLRFLHRRQHLAATVVRAVLHRTRHATCASGRRDRQPGPRLGHPAGPQPVAGAGGAGRTATLCAARPGLSTLQADFPDDETATAVLLQIGAGGNVRTKTMKAFDAEQMSAIIQRTG